MVLKNLMQKIRDNFTELFYQKIFEQFTNKLKPEI